MFILYADDVLLYMTNPESFYLSESEILHLNHPLCAIIELLGHFVSVSMFASLHTINIETKSL